MKGLLKNLIAPTCFVALLFTSCEPDDGELIELNCSTATTSGTITQGAPTTNVIVSVAYLSDGDGSYVAQTIQSTGVLGLTATISAGNFSDGSGTLSYTISGIPQSSGVASFAISVGGQTCTLTIQVYSAVINNASASCGAPNVHNPNKTYGNLTDQEGNVYKTIVIGTQEWMAENLKTSIYRNGEAIANITNANQWVGLTTGAWCYYNNDSQYECPYGKLYNWYAAADPRNVCPTGWHVPTDDELITLTNFLGGDSLAGGKLKSTGLQYWINPNQDATNESGFSALSGGDRNVIFGTFNYVGDSGYWWSSSEFLTAGAWFLGLSYTNGSANRYNTNKQYGLSVRCIKD